MTDSSAADARSAILGPRRQATRAALISAARQVFEETGYEAATIADVVARARSSRATFYLYFSSKQEVYRATAEAFGDELAEGFAGLDLILCDGDVEAFSTWLHRHIEWARHNRSMFLAWSEADRSDDGSGRDVWHATVTTWLARMPWYRDQWEAGSAEPALRLGLFIGQIQFFHHDLFSDAESARAAEVLASAWFPQLRRG